MRFSTLICLIYLSTSIVHGARPLIPLFEDSEEDGNAEVIGCVDEGLDSCVGINLNFEAFDFQDWNSTLL